MCGRVVIQYYNIFTYNKITYKHLNTHTNFIVKKYTEH